jgi:hypothetical protein
MIGHSSVLDAIRDVAQTERAFFNVIRYLDGDSRDQIVTAQLRNTHELTNLLRLYILSQRRETPRENIVMNIPLGNLNSLLDPSGNFMRNFLDPVPVLPTRQQIHAATDMGIATTDTTCVICQETVSSATRIRGCGHCFHAACIDEWFTLNTRCPVCRHDIRNLQSGSDTYDNDNSMHTDEE